MKRVAAALIVALMTVFCACGGGGGERSDGGGSTNVAAAFVANEDAPGADSVSLAESSSSGNAVTLNVNLTDISNVYSVGFDLNFDANRVSFQGYSAGSVLEQGGNSVTYAVTQVTAGRIRVAATRQAAAGDVDVSGSQPVIRLNFRVTDIGVFDSTFSQAAVSNDQTQTLPGITWNAGAFVGT